MLTEGKFKTISYFLHPTEFYKIHETHTERVYVICLCMTTWNDWRPLIHNTAFQGQFRITVQ